MEAFIVLANYVPRVSLTQHSSNGSRSPRLPHSVFAMSSSVHTLSIKTGSYGILNQPDRYGRTLWRRRLEFGATNFSSALGNALYTGGLLSWRHTFTNSEGQEEREGHLGLAPRSGWVLTGRTPKNWEKAKAEPQELGIAERILVMCVYHVRNLIHSVAHCVQRVPHDNPRTLQIMNRQANRS